MPASPFPGMDPYLESQGRWPDVHARLIGSVSNVLGVDLPDNYAAQINEEVHLVTWNKDELRKVVPDVAISRREHPEPEPFLARSGGPALAMLEPDLEPVAITMAAYEEEVRDTWIEILRLPEQRLVTVIELLSPTNKASSGHDKYLQKRFRLVQQGVHLVEIDLLVSGLRPPTVQPLPTGDYYAFVSRAERSPVGEVYAWSIRRRLPKVPIPLLAPDPDVTIDLAALFATAYERGRYARLVDYRAPLTVPLGADDLAWAEGLARAAAGPSS